MEGCITFAYANGNETGAIENGEMPQPGTNDEVTGNKKRKVKRETNTNDQTEVRHSADQ